MDVNKSVMTEDEGESQSLKMEEGGDKLNKNLFFTLSFWAMFLVIGIASLVYLNAPNYNPNVFAEEKANFTFISQFYKVTHRRTIKNSKF
jgi:hypothetical protein